MLAATFCRENGVKQSEMVFSSEDIQAEVWGFVLLSASWSCKRRPSEPATPEGRHWRGEAEKKRFGQIQEKFLPSPQRQI